MLIVFRLVYISTMRDFTFNRGLFQQFDCVEFDTRVAAGMVAEELVRKGMFEDAIKLFDIANVCNCKNNILRLRCLIFYLYRCKVNLYVISR